MSKFIKKCGQNFFFILTALFLVSCVSVELDIDRDNIRDSDLNIITPYEMDTDLKIKRDEIELELTWNTDTIIKSLNKSLR